MATSSTKAWIPLVHQYIESSRHRLFRLTGRSYLVPVEVHIVPDHRTYVRLAGPSVEHSLASARPQDQLILINAEALAKTQDQQIAATILHEMVHLLHGTLIRDPPLPRWLDEGIAQILTENSSPEEYTLLSKAVLGNNHIPLMDLARNFPSDKARQSLAYIQARSVTEFLIRDQYGGSVSALIQALTSEEGPKLLHPLWAEVPAGALELRWLGSFRSPAALSYLTLDPSLIMGFAFLLLIAAYFVVRHRRRQYQSDDFPVQLPIGPRPVETGGSHDETDLLRLDPAGPRDTDWDWRL